MNLHRLRIASAAAMIAAPAFGQEPPATPLREPPPTAPTPAEAPPTPPLPDPPAPLQLTLHCSGVAVVHRGKSATINAYNGQNWTTGTVHTSEPGQEPWSATVEVLGATARIRPETFPIPPVHRGLQDGWWSLDKVAVSEDAIQAVLDINWFNKPDILINRVTGTIAIRGTLTKADGSCLKVDPAQRAF